MRLLQTVGEAGHIRVGESMTGGIRPAARFCMRMLPE